MHLISRHRSRPRRGVRVVDSALFQCQAQKWEETYPAWSCRVSNFGVSDMVTAFYVFAAGQAGFLQVRDLKSARRVGTRREREIAVCRMCEGTEGESPALKASTSSNAEPLCLLRYSQFSSGISPHLGLLADFKPPDCTAIINWTQCERR